MTTISPAGGPGFRWAIAVEASTDRQHDYLKRSLLRSHPLLAGLPAGVIRRIASIADEVVLAPGDILAEQGRVPQWFFLICSGTADVSRDGALVGALAGGEHYGEVPLLSYGVHPVTVRAITPMRAFVIGSQRFMPLVADVALLQHDLSAALARQGELVEAARAERARRLRPVSSAPRSTASQIAREPRLQPSRSTPAPRRAARDDDASSRTQSAMQLRRLRMALTTAVVVSVTLSGYLYHPPFAVVRSGPVIDISRDMTISGAPTHGPRDRYLLLTVRAERPPLFGVAKATLLGDGRVVHVGAARAGSAAQVHDQLGAEFTQSQRDGAAAGAAAAGLTAADRASLKISFRHRDIVGPSAGLIYALAIDDLLSTTDHARGRVIAATGEVDAHGVVEPVSFVYEKAVAARQAGAQLLLAPVSEADQADGVIPVIGVSSVQDAENQLARS